MRRKEEQGFISNHKCTGRCLTKWDQDKEAKGEEEGEDLVDFLSRCVALI